MGVQGTQRLKVILSLQPLCTSLFWYQAYMVQSPHIEPTGFPAGGVRSGDNVGPGAFARSASCGVQERFAPEGVSLRWSMVASLSDTICALSQHFCNHWSSYRLSLRQTWRELKLPTRSSINWMIDIFAGTSTDHKADFTFCLNAYFYLRIFNMALVYAVLHLVMIDLRYLKAKTTPVSNADLQEGDELEGTEL